MYRKSKKIVIPSVMAGIVILLFLVTIFFNIGPFSDAGAILMAENNHPKTDANYNRLINEKSPYLLQHAANPVDWYAWGEEAFEKAKREDKPIFLSIGYSTCHWCHVMEHESFEDSVVAALMNDVFVSIKVDREERPDIDNIYMSVCQMVTGSGGWPLTIIMTPDKKPFFAGTYIPKHSMQNRMGMLDLTAKVDDVWKNNRKDILNSANKITNGLKSSDAMIPGPALGLREINLSYNQLAQNFDATNGGFGGAPKFPTPHNLMFLLRYWKRSNDAQALMMVETTLREMRKGGVYDHIGFGFHRYSTDNRWFLPHFEKMLYDQALLALVYIETYQITGNEAYKKTANEIFTYVLRDLKDSTGGFQSAEDADSEGEEGKFYLFSKNEIREILDQDDTDFAASVFNMTGSGNYAEEASGNKTGTNILHLRKNSTELSENFEMTEVEYQNKIENIRKRIFKTREKRVHPHKDDKVLTDWNGLMIAALAKGAMVFDDNKLADAASDAADFILNTMRTDDGGLLHRYREGDAGLTGFIEDYAFTIWGLIELYEATFEIKYLQSAIELNDYMIKHFWDDRNGGFFFTADNGEELIHRQKEIYDGAIPSGNSVAALNLMRLGRITARMDLEEKGQAITRTFANTVSRHPSGFSMLMLAVDFSQGPSFEIVISGDLKDDDTHLMLSELRNNYIPNRVIIHRPANSVEPEIAKLAEYTKSQTSIDNKATAYVCLNYACQLPTTDIDVMMKLINDAYGASNSDKAALQ
jgi:uncharacterized protein